MTPQCMLIYIIGKFLLQMGQTMAEIVETGNRSSAHCNILDAINAIELNMGPSQEGKSDIAKNGWEDLAAFAFGTQWKDKVVDFETGVIQSRKELLKEQEKQKEKQKIEMATKFANKNNNSSTNNTNGMQPQSLKNNGSNIQPPALVSHKKNGDKLKNLTQKNPHLANTLSNAMKQVSSTANANNNTNAMHKSEANSKAKEPEEDDDAWNAPYLDVVPTYPLLRDRSRLNTSLKIGAMMLATEDEACRGENDGFPDINTALDVSENVAKAEKKVAWDLDQIPSRNFFGSYSKFKSKERDDTGATANKENDDTTSKKRARFDENVQSNGEPSTKRLKPSTNDNSTTPKNYMHLDVKSYRPSYLATFLPSFPPKHTYQPTASQDTSNTSKFSIPTNKQQSSFSSSRTNFDGDPSIRRSLVLQQQHHQQALNSKQNGGEDLSLTVPSGGLSTLDPHSLAPIHEDQKKKDSTRNGVGSSITPLEKISVSRVSKILEGSMDLFHCG